MKKIWIIMMLYGIYPYECIPQHPASPAGVWNEIAVYDCPSDITGLAFDGHDIFTLGGGLPYPYTSYLNKFNPIDTSFSNVCQIPTEGIQYQLSGGLTYKSPWFVSTDQWFNWSWYEPARAVYFDTAGILQGSSTLPRLDTHIICWDKKHGHFWGAVPKGDEIMKINSSGNVLMTIGPLTFGISNLCTQENFFWLASTNDTIYKLDNTGAIIERHASIAGSALAVTFDGLHLWYSCLHKLVKVEVFGTGIPGLKNTLDPILHVYPNPSSGKITIETIDNGHLFVFTVNGEELLQQTITRTTTIIDISKFPRGIYFMRMVGEKGVQVEKIIRQ